MSTPKMFNTLLTAEKINLKHTLASLVLREAKIASDKKVCQVYGFVLFHHLPLLELTIVTFGQ